MKKFLFVFAILATSLASLNAASRDPLDELIAEMESLGRAPKVVSKKDVPLHPDEAARADPDAALKKLAPALTARLGVPTGDELLAMKRRRQALIAARKPPTGKSLI